MVLRVQFVRAYDSVKQQIQCTAGIKNWHDKPRLILDQGPGDTTVILVEEEEGFVLEPMKSQGQ